MLQNMARTLLVTLAVVFAFTVVPSAAFALEGEDDTSTTTTENDDDSGGRSKTVRSANVSDDAREVGSKRLEAAKLKVCKERSKTISSIMVRAVTRGQNQIKVFSAISERVKALYEKKGKTVANYDQLVAAVDGAKSTAESVLADLKTRTFSCDSDDPKGQIQAFKTELQSLNTALKNYRTSVKDLIVGVRSAQGDEQ